jgi:hypothetical protein
MVKSIADCFALNAFADSVKNAAMADVEFFVQMDLRVENIVSVIFFALLIYWSCRIGCPCLLSAAMFVFPGSAFECFPCTLLQA